MRPTTRRNCCRAGRARTRARTAATPAGVGHAGVRRQQQPERPRHDADHRRRLVVDENPAADHRRIAAEAALRTTPSRAGSPAARRRRRPRSRNVRPRARLGAEHVEEVRWSRTPMRSCSGSASPVSAAVLAQMPPNVGKHAAAFAEILQLRAGQRRARITGARQVRPDEREAIRVAIRQRREQQRVDDAEDGGVGADAERRGSGTTMTAEDRAPCRRPRQA